MVLFSKGETGMKATQFKALLDSLGSLAPDEAGGID